MTRCNTSWVLSLFLVCVGYNPRVWTFGPRPGLFVQGWCSYCNMLPFFTLVSIQKHFTILGMLCISTSKHMLAHVFSHGRKRQKTFENDEKKIFVFLHAPYMSLPCTWMKRYFFHHFQMFLYVFDHANACASMRSLVKTHNIGTIAYIICNFY